MSGCLRLDVDGLCCILCWGFNLLLDGVLT